MQIKFQKRISYLILHNSSCRKLSKDHVDKIIKANSGANHYMFGKKKSLEQRLKLSGSNHHNFGKTGEACHNYGRKASIETKKKLSEIRRRNRNIHSHSKKVLVNGVCFYTIKDAAEFNSIASSNLSSILKDRLKLSKIWQAEYINSIL